MLRLTQLAKVAPRVSMGTRGFASTSSLMKKAAAAGPSRKTKITFKVSREHTKAKKPGMTHLEFRDAVGALGFDKLAVDLNGLNVPNLTHTEVVSAQAKIVKYSSAVQEKLDKIGSFQKLQHHELFQKPVSLISQNTTQVYNQVIEKLDSSSSKDNRYCLVGSNGVGKSTVLTQAKALAMSKYQDDVIVLHIDNGAKLVNGTSDYIFNSKLKLYQQPMLTKRWIYKMRQINEGVFKKLKLTHDISFQSGRVDYNLKKGVNTLDEFLLHNHDFGKFAPTSAFQFFVKELQAHSEKVPVLFSCDNVNALTDFAESKYRHPDFTPIHLTEFELGDFVLNVLGGDLSFAKGAVLVAKTSDVGTHRSTLNVALGLENHNPYAHKKFLDLDVANRLRANGPIKPVEIKPWSKAETESMLKFYQQAGVLFVKDYKTKEANQTSQELLEEKAQIRAGNNVAQFDPVAQFEKIVSNQYTITGGNPAHILKATAFTF